MPSFVPEKVDQLRYTSLRGGIQLRERRRRRMVERYRMRFICR
jgi:hypothetical protein